MKKRRLYLIILLVTLLILTLSLFGKKQIEKDQLMLDLEMDSTVTEGFDAPIGVLYLSFDDGSDENYDNRVMGNGQIIVSYPPKVRVDQDFEIKISLDTNIELVFFPRIKLSALSFEHSPKEIELSREYKEKTFLLKPEDTGKRSVTLETSFTGINDSLVNNSRDIQGFVDLSTQESIIERLEIEVTEKANFLGLSNSILSLLQGIAALLGIPSLIELIRARKQTKP